MSHHIVEFKDVYYQYPDGKQAVNGLSARIIHGESVGLVGANGAGKTSLLMLLTGILSATAGQIRVGDTVLTKRTLPLIRRTIGFSFQNPDDQLFMSRVYDDVAFGPRNYGLDEQEVEYRVLKALETVGAAHLKDRPPYKLSGGEKRAAALAAVLSMEPNILVLDEPTAALDPRSRRRLINLLKGFTHTKIIATHDMDMVMELCERAIGLNEGCIHFDGASQEVLVNQKLLAECGLEMPLALQGCPRCHNQV
ncbi:MAG: ABC transporter ATP-binding protein [Syntrophomonadaceae bacterium]|nr:ABC transporter ATP-binding protein [Syntrophomonadaceae bacterium]